MLSNRLPYFILVSSACGTIRLSTDVINVRVPNGRNIIDWQVANGVCQVLILGWVIQQKKKQQYMLPPSKHM